MTSRTKFCAPKPNSDPDDTEPREQRTDIEPQSLQRTDDPDHDDDDEDRVA